MTLQPLNLDNWSQLCYEKFMIRATHNCFFLWRFNQIKHKHYSSWWTKIHRWSLPPSAPRRLGWKMTIGTVHDAWHPFPRAHMSSNHLFLSNWKWLFPRLYLPSIQSCLFQWTIIVRVYCILINCIWEHLKQSSKGLCSALYEYSTIFLHVKIRDYP